MCMLSVTTVYKCISCSAAHLNVNSVLNSPFCFVNVMDVRLLSSVVCSVSTFHVPTAGSVGSGMAAQCTSEPIIGEDLGPSVLLPGSAEVPRRWDQLAQVRGQRPPQVSPLSPVSALLDLSLPVLSLAQAACFPQAVCTRAPQVY